MMRFPARAALASLAAAFLLVLSGCSQVPSLSSSTPTPAPASAPQAESAPQAGDPKASAKIHTELAALYFQAGSAAVALDEIRLALDADSDYVQAYSVRGLIYAQLKENAKAEQDFARALRMAPNDPEVNNNYGWYLCSTGRERQSIDYFMKAVRDPLYATPDRAYTNAGTCSLKVGDLDAAQRYLLQAVQLSRDAAGPARLELAKIFYQRGNLSEARIYLTDAMRAMEPPPPEALWLGFRLERKLGNKAAEGSYATQLRSRYPTSPEYQEFLKGNYE
jgi:type IV pilus assembly protein PilF